MTDEVDDEQQEQKFEPFGVVNKDAGRDGIVFVFDKSGRSHGDADNDQKYYSSFRG